MDQTSFETTIRLTLGSHIHDVLSRLLQGDLLQLHALTLQLLLLQLVLQHSLGSLFSLFDTLECALLFSLQDGDPGVQLFHVLFLGASELSRVRERLTAEHTVLERIVDSADAGVKEGVLGQSVVNCMLVVTCASIKE